MATWLPALLLVIAIALLFRLARNITWRDKWQDTMDVGHRDSIDRAP